LLYWQALSPFFSIPGHTSHLVTNPGCLRDDLTVASKTNGQFNFVYFPQFYFLSATK